MKYSSVTVCKASTLCEWLQEQAQDWWLEAAGSEKHPKLQLLAQLHALHVHSIIL